MNERLLTEKEQDQIDADTAYSTSTAVPGRAGHYVVLEDALCKAQDAKTRAATLRECGQWLDAYGGQTPMVMLDEGIERLKRGEAPWEHKKEADSGH